MIFILGILLTILAGIAIVGAMALLIKWMQIGYQLLKKELDE